MKRIVTLLLIVCVMFSYASAEQEKSIIFHPAFGLDENSTPDEVYETISSIYATTPASFDKNMLIPNHKYLYDLPVDYIHVGANKAIGVTYFIEFVFDAECLTAENIHLIYHQLCADYGEPTVCEITKETTTLNGKEDNPLYIDDIEAIQSSIEQANIDGTVCWDNVTLAFSASSYDSGSAIKLFFIHIALNIEGLAKQVQEYYGITEP